MQFDTVRFIGSWSWETIERLKKITWIWIQPQECNCEPLTLAQICWSCSSEMQPLLDKVVNIWAMQHFCSCRLVFSLVTNVLFLSFSGIQETLQRLTAMIRGIGDPLVAVYARAYLCRVRRIILSDYILYCSRLSLQILLFYNVVFHAFSWCIVDDKTSKNPVDSNWRSHLSHRL